MITESPLVFFHKNTLNNKVIDKITNYVDTLSEEQGTLHQGEESNSVRKSSLKWIFRNQQSEWIYDTLSSIVDPVNNSVFQFKLSSIDTIQYTQYHKSGDKYDFHVDMAPGSKFEKNLVRKLSMIIQMSDEHEYEGGDVEFMSGKLYNDIAPKAKGSIIIFPAFTMHKVDPILSGKRNSLVVWFMGPKFT